MPAADIGDSQVLFHLFQEIAAGNNTPQGLMAKNKMDRGALSQHLLFASREDLIVSIFPNEGDRRLRRYSLNIKGFLRKFIKWSGKRKNLAKEEINMIEGNPVFQKRFQEFTSSGIQKIRVETLHEAFISFCSFFITIERENQSARKAVEIIARVCFAGLDHSELREYYRDLLQPNEK
jgi:hypothetical protein